MIIKPIATAHGTCHSNPCQISGCLTDFSTTDLGIMSGTQRHDNVTYLADSDMTPYTSTIIVATHCHS